MLCSAGTASLPGYACLGSAAVHTHGGGAQVRRGGDTGEGRHTRSLVHALPGHTYGDVVPESMAEAREGASRGPGAPSCILRSEASVLTRPAAHHQNPDQQHFSRLRPYGRRQLSPSLSSVSPAAGSPVRRFVLLTVHLPFWSGLLHTLRQWVGNGGAGPWVGVSVSVWAGALGADQGMAVAHHVEGSGLLQS